MSDQRALQKIAAIARAAAGVSKGPSDNTETLSVGGTGSVLDPAISITLGNWARLYSLFYTMGLYDA